MIHRLVVIAAVLLVTPVATTAQEPLVQSLRGLFEVTRQNIMATAQDLDAEMYAFRPTDEVRSSGEILAHIADGQFIFCSAAVGESNPQSASFEQTATAKADIIEGLERGFAYCEGIFDRTTDSDADRQVEFFTGPNTTAGVLAFNSAHNYEHYGNLVTYMRLNGIVPPSSR